MIPGRDVVCRILRGLFVTGFLCLTPEEAIQATSWHFSSCNDPSQPGGARLHGCWRQGTVGDCFADSTFPVGSVDNPFCPNFNNDTVVEFAALVTNNIRTSTDPEFNPGDTINLCAGACNGSGIATVEVTAVPPVPASGHECVGNTWMGAKNNGPLTIQSFPGEFITISGDGHVHNVKDSNDPDVLIGSAYGTQDWTFKNLGLYRSGAHWVCALDPSGAPGWTFDGVSFQEASVTVWGDTDGVATGPGLPCLTGSNDCQCGAGNNNGPPEYGFYLGVHGTRTLTINNCSFSTACSSMFRMVNNINSEQADGSYSFVITNSTFQNGTTGIEFWKTHNIKIANNTFKDLRRAIGGENGITYVDIQDNTIECQGIYTVQTAGECTSAIGLEWGDGIQANDHTAHHIRVRRNKIIAHNTGVNRGHFRSGLLTQFRCDQETSGGTVNNCLFAANPGVVIENNIVSGVTLPLQSGGEPHQARAAIGIWAFNPITVRNNTVYNSTYAFVFDGLSTASSTYDISAFNNLSYETASAGASLVLMPQVVADGNETDFTFNNFFASTTSRPMVKYCTTKAGDNTCTAVGTTCTYASGYAGCLSGAGNIILASQFVDPANPNPSLRDYHLGPGDTANVGAGTTFSGDCSTLGDGIECDFDKDSRPMGAAFDIGADEAILQDGGFESAAFGAGKWLQFPNPCDCGSSATSTTFARSGSRSGFFAGATCIPPGIDCGGFSQTFNNLTIGRTYTLSGYFLVTASLPNDFMSVLVTGITSTNPTCQFELLNPIFGLPGCIVHRQALGVVPASWQFFTTVFRAEATSHSMYFSSSGLSTPPILTVYFDDLSLR